MAPHIGLVCLLRRTRLAPILLLCVVALACSIAQTRAQSIGGSVTSVVRPGTLGPLITPPTPRILPPDQPEIIPPAPPANLAPGPPPPGPPVRVDQVRIEGVTVFGEQTLRPLYADVIGKPVPRVRLDEIVQALQARYRREGYILSLVRGEFEKSGPQIVFVIRATEGYISDVKLDGNIGPVGTLVLKMLKHLEAARPVSNSDLERWLLLANDIPGVSVRAVLRRQGDTPGAVELVAQLSRKPVSGLLNFDNRGPQEAGPPEMLVSGSTNAFTNLGERVTALLFTTFNREQIFGQVNGDTFIGSSGLEGHAYWGRGNSMPGGILTGVGFNGDIEIGGGSLSYPFVRSRAFNFSSDLDVDEYRSSITLAGTSPSGSDLTIARLGSHIDLQDDWLLHQLAANTLDTKLSQGLVGTSSVRPGNDTHFIKLNGAVSRLQDLFTVGEVRTALKSSIGGQFTNNILPPSEKYFLGGIQFGRGFFNGEVTGDRALGTSLELQVNTGFTNVPLLNPGYRLPAQFYTFWDYGRGYNLAPLDLDFTIQSVGTGVRSQLTPWAFLELEGVHRLTVHPQGPSVPREGEYAFFTRVTLTY